MTEPRFDEVIHQPQRLRLCAMLYAVDAIEFAALRDRLELTDSALSKHLSRLEAAGYVQQERILVRGRRRGWVSLTATGREAFRRHVADLQDIAATAGLDDG